MSLRFLLDTSIVSAPIARNPDSVIVRRISQHASESAIAAPVWHELLYGVSRTRTRFAS
ncbi:MAG: PIN domain-containing protein [Acidobacteria bacterium]|nr:PIN domain-containing protein [Acidobacteriota bacterium]